MILPFSGTMMFLQYEKGRAKRHMIEVLQKKERGEIMTLTLQSQEYAALRWEHEQEFEHKGEMYDLVSKETKDGMIILHCIHDTKETSINKSIVKFIAGLLHSNPLHDQQLIAYAEFTKHLAPITSITLQILSIITAIVHVMHQKSTTHFGYDDLSLPPPKYS